MSSENSAKSRERKLGGNETLPEAGAHAQFLSPMACQYLELQPSENNVLAAATMAPRAQKFEPGKLLSQVEKIRQAEKLRVMECRRSLAQEMELDELESLLRHLGCSEPSQGVLLNDPIWQDSIVSPALHVYEELRQANGNPVEKDKTLDAILFLEMHEHKSGLKRPEFPCAIGDALSYCSGIVGHPTAALKEALKDLLTHSRWKLKNAKNPQNSNQLKPPLRKKNPNSPLPPWPLSPKQIEEFEQDQLLVHDERQLALILKHFGNFWNLAQSHYLAEHEAKDESKIKRVAALKKSDRTGVVNRERIKWLDCARAFTKQYGKIIRERGCDSSENSSIIDHFITDYRSENGGPAGDLIKALFQTILKAKDDSDATPGIVMQRAIESLGARRTRPFKTLNDQAIQEITEVVLGEPKTKRSTSVSKPRTKK